MSTKTTEPGNAAGYALDPCDWDPDRQGPARANTPHHGWAVWGVGMKGGWHLCESCAALPTFKRLRKRVWIGPGREAEGGTAGDADASA